MTSAASHGGDVGYSALPHLAGGGASVRQAIAAHFLRDCVHIVEIGGAGAPITDFLTHAPRSVTVIDPKITPFEAATLRGAPCRVRHVAMKLQAHIFEQTDGALGVALLGLSLKPLGSRPAVSDALVALLRRASVVVIDYAPALERAVAQAPALIEAARLSAVVSIDLSITDGVIEQSDYARRKLLVLRPGV